MARKAKQAAEIQEQVANSVTEANEAVEQTGETSETTNTETSTTNQNGVNTVETVKFVVKRSITSLENMEEIELAKEEEYSKITNEQEALERLGNSRDELIKVINDGLMARAKAAAEDSDEGWRIFTEKGEINGPFVGEMADSKKVQLMVLQFAKFNGYSNVPKSDPKRTEKRRKIREAAEDLVKGMITSNPAMKAQFAFTPGQQIEVVESDDTAKQETETGDSQPVVQ